MQMNYINVQRNPLLEPKYEFLGTALISTGIWLEQDLLSFQGTKFLGFWTYLQGESAVGKPETSSLLHTATMGQPGHQYFSLAEVQPHQAPTGDSCPRDVPWTVWACHVNISREACHTKILHRDFAREMLCSNCFFVIMKAGEGMSLLLTSQFGTVLSQKCETQG